MLHFAYFLVEFRGIPPREPPISGTRVTTNWAGERPTRHCQVRICTPFPAVSLFVLLSFLPPVRALLCGRLPHTAPLVLPARPRADKTTLLLSRHPHTRCLVGEFAMRLARVATSFSSQIQRTSTCEATRVAPRDQRTLWST